MGHALPPDDCRRIRLAVGDLVRLLVVDGALALGTETDLLQKSHAVRLDAWCAVSSRTGPYGRL